MRIRWPILAAPRLPSSSRRARPPGSRRWGCHPKYRRAIRRVSTRPSGRSSAVFRFPARPAEAPPRRYSDRPSRTALDGFHITVPQAHALEKAGMRRATCDLRHAIFICRDEAANIFRGTRSCPAKAAPHRQLVDVLVPRNEPVERGLVPDEQPDQQHRGETDGQSGHVDCRIQPVAREVTQGGGEVVPEHGDSV